ncbi:hypothetical protein ACFL6E_00820 [Candidatus Neomarinimicrobiota bacterium]
MFEINLLSAPGLQAGIRDFQFAPKAASSVIDEESSIIQRLQARKESQFAQAVEIPVRTVRNIYYLYFLLAVSLFAGGYWGYNEYWRQMQRRGGISSITPPPSSIRFNQPISDQVTSAGVMANFLANMPIQITLDFMDAGAGVLIYRVWGEDLTRFLPQLNAMVIGYEHSDLLAPEGVSKPGYWLGTVAYKSDNGTGALRPVELDYNEFFDNLELQLRGSGAQLIATISGFRKAGEYVIKGTILEIQDHLTEIDSDASSIKYHRMSLIREGDLVGDRYKLRVIFNLVEDSGQSQLLSSRVDSGA